MPTSVLEGTWGAKKGGEAKLRFPTHYLLLNSSNSGRGTEGTRMLCFLPFGFACQKVYRDITFSPRSIREQANSKLNPPSSPCLYWTGLSGGFCYLGAFRSDSSKCGVFSQYIPFPLFVSPPTVQFGWEGSPTTFGSVTTSYLVHGKKAIH